HCTFLPRFLEAVAGAVADLPPAATALNLSHNSLRRLPPAAFARLPLLRTLDLAHNRLAGIAPGAFAGLGALATLDLAHNRLAELAEGAFAGLGNLSSLRLDRNPLATLAPGALLPLANLRRLSLRGGRLPALGPVALAVRPLPRLRLLDLCGNNLSALGPGPPLPPSLLALRLCNNSLGALAGGSPGLLPALRALDLSYNNISEAAPFAAPALRRLHNVSLRFNRILVAGPRAFADAPHLRLLRLDVNGLARLDRQALQGLRELRELRLDNNLLTDLYDGSFADLGQLRTLNLRNNRVSVLFPGAFAGLARLQTLDLGGNNLRHLAPAALQGLGGLRRLYLDRNRLQEVSAAAFAPVQASLGVLDLRANALRYISRRPRQRPPFQHLRCLYDLKLQAQQPYGLRIIPHRFFEGLTALRSLYLSQNWLLAVPADAFDDLAQLRYLTLADSSGGMGDLPAGVFKNLTSLRVLDLENVGLRSLGPEVFGNLSRLEQLQLAKNELRTLDRRLDGQLPALRYLDLRKCPLSCACANAWLPAWLGRARVQVVYLYNYSCGGGGGGRPPAYLHSFDTRVCFLDVGLYLFAGTAPAVLLLLALPLLHHRAYWRLRYHLYLLRAWANGRWRPEQRRYAYDSFVSYNSADEGWVLGELVPELERGALRLCLHHRDFSPGRAIVDNIVDAIYNSRKTVCVVSRSYLRSEWCSLEIQLASYRLFDELRDVLVLVFLEAIPDAELSAYHRMRRVLLKRTYLSWPPEPPARPLFWAKLKRDTTLGRNNLY
uniref:TIR domain-containing protein n=1 Tax=Strix occidentalis caurina TaxID=311401 RepID=A0A8D0FBR2_STROC